MSRCIYCGLLLQRGQNVCSWCACNHPREAKEATCTCPAGSYDAPNAVHEPYCKLAEKP